MFSGLKRILLLLLTATALAWLIGSQFFKPEPPTSAPGPFTIHVVGNGWHAGLLLPAQAINARLPLLRQRFPGASHYEIGWGDVGFYRASKVTAGLALEAMFASRGSVMHVVAVTDVPHFLKGSDSAALCIDDAAYQRMASLVADSFARSAGKPVDAGPGIYGNSQFYIATGSYNALNTCNRWTASILEAAGLAISPRISLTASSVLGAAQRSAMRCEVVR
ncbi:MAG: TIGR02117 family protein [Comamonas sp.]|jgi:uncharacterized protein (TIGR02117 family)|uniref:TIGR02117 family protein n=1 Tax=Comamonas sp. TaxID=34028 RepID=UPI002823F80F|nr:TIGR02117 family protein [Comamonas sp.]MDR0212966.1 TIGR02117 family protein [Comamonas sp.]